MEVLGIFLEKYMMHIFGIVAFFSILLLGTIALFKRSEDPASFILYGILVFILNLFYLKLIRLSRQDYEDQLKKEKEYSQALLKSQKKFLRYAVHETNTPLAVIMANIELYELENGRHPVLSNIEAATKNIYGIYDDLSYLTKKDRISYRRQPILLNEFIQSRIEFFDIVAQQSGLCFDFTAHCDPCIILINETKLQRIVDNNITNAVKYTKHGEVIHISLTEDNLYYILNIQSRSTIIEDPQKIFNAYYRENSVKDGLGLGLNLVKSICEEENINIELHSDEHHTSFKYYFYKGIQ